MTMKNTSFLVVVTLPLLLHTVIVVATEPIEIGTRRELFTDTTLIERIDGQLDWRLHQPTPREVVMEHDEPWEGNNTTYHCVFKDGDRYRMFYVGRHSTVTQKGQLNIGPSSFCYTESDDGIHWQHNTASAPGAPRQYHHVTVYDGRIWVLRGYRPGDRNDVWYSSDGTNWNRHFGAPWAIRHAASVFVHDGSLWITAGSCMQRDVWRLQRSDDQDYRSPVEPDPLAVIEIQMDGVRNKRIFAFDPRHPDGSPKPFDL